MNEFNQPRDFPIIRYKMFFENFRLFILVFISCYLANNVEEREKDPNALVSSFLNLFSQNSEFERYLIDQYNQLNAVQAVQDQNQSNSDNKDDSKLKCDFGKIILNSDIFKKVCQEEAKNNQEVICDIGAAKLEFASDIPGCSFDETNADGSNFVGISIFNFLLILILNF